MDAFPFLCQWLFTRLASTTSTKSIGLGVYVLPEQGRASVFEHSRPAVSAKGTPCGDHVVRDIPQEVVQCQPEIAQRDVAQLGITHHHPEAVH